MENILIRNANFDDLPYLLQLRKESINEKKSLKKCVNILNFEENNKKFFINNFNKDSDIVVAENNNNLVGMFYVKYMHLLPGLDSKMDKSAFLMFNYITKDFRNINNWNQLLDKSIQNAKKRGFNVFELVTTPKYSSQLEKLGFSKTPFPVVKLDLRSYNDLKYKSNLETSYRLAENSDIEEIIKIRRKYLNGIFNLNDKLIIFDMERRLKEYLKKYLGKRLDIFLEIYKGKIASAIFYLYYENIPEDENDKFIIGIPSNFYTEKAHINSWSLEMLFDYSMKILNSKGISILEMAIPEEKLEFYKKLGFCAVNDISMYKEIRRI